MPAKEELDGLHLTVLAARCKQIANTKSEDSGIRDEARGLWDEYTALLKRKTPPPSYHEKKEIESLEAALKARMVDFLTLF